MAEKKIGNRYYRAGNALATDALKLQFKLLALIGPAVDKLPAIFAGRDPKATVEQKAASDAAALQAIMAMFQQSGEDEWVAFIERTLTLGKIAHDPKGNWDDIILDVEFVGDNAKDLFPVVAFILREVLGDFISGALASGFQAQKA